MASLADVFRELNTMKTTGVVRDDAQPLIDKTRLY